VGETSPSGFRTRVTDKKAFSLAPPSLSLSLSHNLRKQLDGTGAGTSSTPAQAARGPGGDKGKPKTQATAVLGKAGGKEALTEDEKIKKRRQQDAERKRRQRAMASEETKRREREKDAQRKRDKRAQITSSPEELRLRRERDAERMRKKRAQAPREVKEEVKKADADRKRKKRQESSHEQHGAGKESSPAAEGGSSL